MGERMQGAEAYRRLATAQKPAYGAPAYSRWVNRPAGRFLAVAAYRAGMSPNQVTAVSAVLSLSGIVVLAVGRPSWGVGLAVAGLLAVGYAMDSADGQLARLTGLGRPSGEWLDHTVDMAKLCLLHGAVLVSWWRWGAPGHGTSLVTTTLPLAFLTVNVLAFFGWLLADLMVRLIRAERRSGAARDRGPARALRSILRLPSDYGLLLLTFCIWPTSVFLPVYAVLMLLNLVILAAALPTWFGQVRSAEDEAS